MNQMASHEAGLAPASVSTHEQSAVSHAKGIIGASIAARRARGLCEGSNSHFTSSAMAELMMKTSAELMQGLSDNGVCFTEDLSHNEQLVMVISMASALIAPDSKGILSRMVSCGTLQTCLCIRHAGVM